MTSYRKLAVRSDRGHVQEPAETYSTTLYVKTGDNFALAADSLVVESALEILAKRISRGSLLASPAATRDYLVARLSDLQHEVFGVIWLTTRHRVIEIVELFRGTIDGASVYPREVVKSALAHNAAAGIIFHGHPSGVCEASQADEMVTARLKDSLALIEVRLLDHLIIAGRETFSFAESGRL